MQSCSHSACMETAPQRQVNQLQYTCFLERVTLLMVIMHLTTPSSFSVQTSERVLHPEEWHDTWRDPGGLKWEVGSRRQPLEGVKRGFAPDTSVCDIEPQATTEAALARMKATVAWAPLVTLLVQHVPDQVVACAGEESTEAAYQARRQSVNVSSQQLPLQLMQLLLVLSACNHDSSAMVCVAGRLQAAHIHRHKMHRQPLLLKQFCMCLC